tara:strand:+ start:2175 stop:3068 length:894 start_codon:yes stop_codon:yes gene_type:complete
MICLIVGYGSIGRRHAKIIKKLNLFRKIYVHTKQKLPNYLNKCLNIKEVKNINPDYIVIASETSKHFKQLKFINRVCSKKTILVEKPLFNKINNINNIKNKVFVGYNLRLHPVIQKLKELIKGQRIYSLKSLCFSNLKDWRKNRKYYKTSSARKNSGGVIFDLSHEFDFVSWLFGNLRYVNSVKKKNSDLKINTEDYLSLNAIAKKTHISFNFNYYSNLETRKIYIDGKNISLIGDLINNSVEYKSNKKRKKIFFTKFKRDDMFIKLHSNLIKNKFQNICTYTEGITLTKFIDQIKR